MPSVTHGIEDALIDGVLGATGAGIASKLNKLNRVRKLRKLARERGLQPSGKNGRAER